ncbi:MAG: M20/M25/M40 family metallo-hydrolase [Alphaproteobacteria bacterium]|nr:MAG: M20/M25/M40 family metallo-hydrolase [Alphaproteobacteria bacterium]
MKKILAGLGAAVALLLIVVLVRTAQFKPEPLASELPAPTTQVDAEVAARHLSEAVQFKTISPQPPQQRDREEFEAFINWLGEAYPLVHQNLVRQRISDQTLLYKWIGTDPAAKPILLTAHYDVVPVVPGTEGDWAHPPFAGDIVEGVIWGRGSLDDKSAVIALLEAATALLEEGFSPSRTIYFSFGHDEEIGGTEGARGVAEYFMSRGIEAAWSLDEGSFVLADFIPGIELPMASINIAEKGYVSIKLAAHAAGGHSSVPPKETAVGILAEAIIKLQENQPPAKLEGAVAQNYDALARHMSFSKRMFFANQWLFGGLLEDSLTSEPFSNAQMRTTTAPTMLSGSIKENVLPIEAIGIVNFRIHPRDSVASVLAHVTNTIDDPRVDVSIVSHSTEPSEVSSTSSEGYQALAKTVTRVFGETIVAPGMTVAGTDSKNYGLVAKDSYRFNPMTVTPKDLTGFHGTNESLNVDNLHRAAVFYAELIKETSSQPKSEE